MLYVLKDEDGNVINEQEITNEVQIEPFTRAGFVLVEDEPKKKRAAKEPTE